MNYKKVQGLKVYYTPELDGGGASFGQQYIPVVKEMYGKVDTIMEFGAGPGFIGFGLIGAGLCNKVIFVDCNPEVKLYLEKTIKENKLPEKNFEIIISDVFETMPDTLQVDLVVSNPPHFKIDKGLGVRTNDLNWKVHKKFYKDVHKYLNFNGAVLIQENTIGSNFFEFIPMASDLVFEGAFMYKDKTRDFNPYYFIKWSKPSKKIVYIHQKLKLEQTNE